jgi:xanthine dehydrogenase YagS FAD-binding subunit
VHYHRPSTLDLALSLLSGRGAHPLGGGTDLLVAMREGLVRPDVFVDLRGVPGLDALTWGAEGSLRIGAAARISTLARDSVILASFPALAAACESVGSPALRSMGTLGGSLCQRPRCWYFRSGIPCLKSGGTDCPAVDGENRHLAILGGGPCHAVHPSDPAVALSALDAIIHLDGPHGVRTVPIADFFVLPDPDPRQETILAAGEFVTAVEVPAVSSGSRQRYTKVLQRGAWDFALASLAVVRRTDGGVRMVMGGVAPVPWRVNPSVEEDVAAGPLADDDLDALADRALYDARPLSDNGYKVALAKSLLREAMAFASAP